MRKVAIFSLIVIAIVSSVVLIDAYIDSSRENSWLIRAKDAGNPAQVNEFLAQYKQSLSAAGKVEDKYTSVFQYPGTKMDIYIRTIGGLMERAQDLTSQSPTDTSYQMGLLNLEKDLGDMETVAFSVWVAHWGWIWWVSFGVASVELAGTAIKALMAL